MMSLREVYSKLIKVSIFPHKRRSMGKGIYPKIIASRKAFEALLGSCQKSIIGIQDKAKKESLKCPLLKLSLEDKEVIKYQDS